MMWASDREHDVGKDVMDGGVQWVGLGNVHECGEKHGCHA